jgi:hypothetical protein
LRRSIETGNALQRLGEIGVGELADFFCRHRIDDALRIALDVAGPLKAGANSGDHDLRFSCRRRRLLLRRIVRGRRRLWLVLRELDPVHVARGRLHARRDIAHRPADDHAAVRTHPIIERGAAQDFVQRVLGREIAFDRVAALASDGRRIGDQIDAAHLGIGAEGGAQRLGWNVVEADCLARLDRSRGRRRLCDRNGGCADEQTSENTSLVAHNPP